MTRLFEFHSGQKCDERGKQAAREGHPPGGNQSYQPVGGGERNCYNQEDGGEHEQCSEAVVWENNFHSFSVCVGSEYPPLLWFSSLRLTSAFK